MFSKNTYINGNLAQKNPLCNIMFYGSPTHSCSTSDRLGLLVYCILVVVLAWWWKW